MSQENVERVSRFIEHVNRTGELGPDFDSVFHPEMEFEDEIGAYNTRDEVRAFLQGFAQAIGGLHAEVEDGVTLGKLKRNKKKGTAVQLVNVPLPDAGTLTLSGKFLKTQTKPVADTGVVKLKVIAKGKVRKLLKRKGKARTQETVTYKPVGQSPNAVSKKVKLLKKLKRH
jgi:SnoaL-like domain